jgi:hypothetical protein
VGWPALPADLYFLRDGALWDVRELLRGATGFRWSGSMR